jgi:hypothetical protein
MEHGQEGNGKAPPCFIAHDCPLCQAQDQGNGYLKEIRDCLMKAATSETRVSTLVFYVTISILTVIIVVQKVIDSNYEATATSGGRAVSIRQSHESK